jgi:glucosamine 6-phosphate synthetase-like amidotransferase/phosphosugar isomerase protein
MCGIIGYSCCQPVDGHRYWLKNLIIESNIRGTHAYGISYAKSGIIITEKFRTIDGLLKFIEKIDIPENLIIHNRYDTSGDYHVIENNQPIQIDNFSLAFNGVISMRTRIENEKYFGVKLDTDNDGEIFLKLYIDHRNMIHFIDNDNISFAGLMLYKDTLVALRNKKRPLYRIKGEGVTLFASTSDIFKRALNIAADQIPELTYVYG